MSFLLQAYTIKLLGKKVHRQVKNEMYSWNKPDYIVQCLVKGLWTPAIHTYSI